MDSVSDVPAILFCFFREKTEISRESREKSDDGL